jgi:capsular polysaccharide transport system permease protein
MSENANIIEATRRAKANRLKRQLQFWVGIPTLLAVIYYGLIHSDYYQSESSYSIQSTDQGGASLDSLFGVLPGMGSDKDALTVKEYILSRDVLKRLDQEHAFLKHYQESGADWFSRLSRDTSFEDAFDYYLSRVDVDYDTESGISTLKVRALDAEQAAQFANALLKYSEELVNELSDRAETDHLDLARQEVVAGEERLARARTNILLQQRSGEDINPAESAAAIMGIRGTLEGELARAQAELTEISSYMRDDAPRVIALKNKIESLETQVRNENRRLVNPDEDSLSSSIARFEPMVLEKEFAEQAYQSALTFLEIARAEAAKQHRYLATIVSPSIPDEATHPKRIMGIFTVLLVTLAAFGIGSLLIAAVREHARI